jgi:hypothetical protein
MRIHPRLNFFYSNPKRKKLITQIKHKIEKINKHYKHCKHRVMYFWDLVLQGTTRDTGNVASLAFS